MSSEQPTNGQKDAPPNPLLLACQTIAKGGVDACKQLGRELKVSGRKIDVSQLTRATYGGQELWRAIKKDPATDEELKELGEVLQAVGAAAALVTMPPGLGRLVKEGQSIVPLITDRLIEQLPHDEATFARQRRTPLAVPDVSAMAGPRRPYDPDDSNEAGLRMAVHESTWIKVLALFSLLALVGYIGIRLWDLAEAHKDEKSGWRTSYRFIVIFVELVFGGTGVAAIVSRTQRLRLESLSNASHDLPFTINDVVAILTVTDEDERAISASIASHYKATKPSINGKVPPFRVVIVAEAHGSDTPAARAVAAMQPQYSNLLLFTKKELAEQEYVLNADDEEAQAALNVVLEDNMYLGQVLFYTLDRLFLQYGHAVSDAAIIVMGASSIVDPENYYPYVTGHLQRPGFAAISTPTVSRNKLAATDFIDSSAFTYERDTLSSVAAEGKFVLNPSCFAIRGYSLWRMLRRLEMENVDTSNLLWATYAVHIESRQASIATMTQHAPITSVLVPSHGPTVLSNVLDRTAEGYDVSRIYERERAVLSWNLHNPLRAPHDAARAAVVMELMTIIVILVTALKGISPWSTDNLIVPGAFLVHYILMMLFALVTPFSLSLRHAAVGLRNRALVSAHCWLYFLNLSRFNVDRRGHFRAIGETATADLVSYKEKQQEEKEAAMVKEHAEAQKAKEAAARHKEEAKNKAALDAIAAKAAKKEAAMKAKATALAEREAKKEAARKEKLRRQRRGPKRQMEAVAEGAEASDDLGHFEMPPIDHSFHMSMEIQPLHAANGEPQPVAEGIFGRKKAPAATGAPAGTNGDSGHSEEAEATNASVVRPKNTVTNHLLPKDRPKQVKVPKFNAPKVSEGGSRTNKGSVHRPHANIKLLSVPVVLLAIAGATIGALLCVTKVFGANLPVNYTMLEILTARIWYIACVVLGIFVLLAALIYIAHIGRFAGLVANRIIGALIVVLSALCIVAIGLTPFFASTILKTRNAEYDLRDLHAKSMRFFAAEQAGQPTSVLTPEWRKAPTDGNVRNTKINQPLNGGWYTGPGLSKVTWPQAIAVTELSFALITHYDILSTMPSAVPGPLKDRTAAHDLRDILQHSATYLLNCFDPETNSLVSVVSSPGGESPNPSVEWAKPQDRQNANVRYVDVTNQGTETFAAVTAAYASLSVALKPFEDTNDLTRKLLESAERTFKVLQRSVRSYASLAENAALAQSWPSTEALLADDKLLAAGMMLLATGRQEYRNAANGYFTLAQQQRAAANRLHDFTMAVDDHWWLANLVLFHADRSNSRYHDNLSRFSRAWTDQATALDPPAPNLKRLNGLVTATPPSWTGAANAFVSPGPLGMTVRAMSIIALHATSQTETDTERAATCFAKGQLRHIMGLNPSGRSYIAGVAPDGASPPRQLVDRGAGPPTFSDSPNPNVLSGALVHGPSVNGAYSDRRSAAQHSGISLLNNSPLSTLLASLESRALEIEDCIGLRPRKVLKKTTNVKDQKA